METKVSLLTGSMPRLRLSIVDSKTNIKVVSTLCYFRHYDWAWNWNDGDEGYCGGLDVCNGSSFELPYGDAPDYATIIRVSLAAAIERWRSELAEVAGLRCAGADTWDWKRAVNEALTVAKPAIEALADHAIANPSAQFSRVARPENRGGRSVGVKCDVEGFDPEPCWDAKEDWDTSQVRRVDKAQAHV